MVLHEALIAAALAIVGFVSTNVDNLLLLLGFMASSRYGIRAITAGYLAAVAVVLGLGLVASFAAVLTRPTTLGYVGVLPLSLGLWRLLDLFRNSGAAESAAPVGGGGAVAVFLVMLANSGDSAAVFLPLLAETEVPLVYLIVAVVLATAALWCRAARWLVRRDELRPLAEWLGRYVTPWLLVAIGLYILADTPTDDVF